MDGAPPGEENFEILSIEDRLSHKSWKARLSAYTSLITLFKQTVSDEDPSFRPYTQNAAGTIREWVRDSNAVAQEKGVEAACSLLEWGGKNAGRTRSEVVPSIVEKCLGSARAGTRTKAIELCLLFIEVEEDQAEGVIADVTPGLDVKQPKVVAGTVMVLKEMVRQFGSKTISLRPILRLLPKIFSHADKTVRAEGTLLALALHAYLGPALTSHLSELKPVQVKELTEAFEEADKGSEGFGGLKQSRFTRSQKREKDVKEAEGALEGNRPDEPAEEEDSAPDPFDFASPVDILSSLPDDFYTNLSSSSWKARSELSLEPLLTLVKTPRIKPGSYDELTRALSERVKGDANVVCVMLAAGCLENLAKGLREEFARYREGTVASLLSRTKEKKANVLEALGNALDAISQTISISELTADIILYAGDKNPSVKCETLKFYARCLRTSSSAPSKSDLVPLTDIHIKALSDSAEPVRAAAAEGLGTLVKIFGERAFGGAIDALDDLRKSKVKEAADAAVVKCKAGAAAPAARSTPVEPAVVKPKPKPVPVAKKENIPMEFGEDSIPPGAVPKVGNAPPRSTSAPRPLVKKAPVASTSSAPPAKKIAPPPSSGPSKSAPSKPSEPLKYKFTQEDAEFQAETVLPSEIFKELSDGNWKVRLGAVEALHSWLSGGEMESVESELVVRYLGKKPGWKESNFQVSGKMFSIFQLLAESSPSFAKASIALATPGLSDKLGDMKLKKPAGDALTAFTEKSSLQFVLSQAYEPMTKQKAPKAQADAMAWVDQAIRAFGIGGLSVREMIDFLKVGLKSTNAAVRTSATKTLVTVKLFVGADISTFLQDLNPALLTTIESEFEKISGETPPEPTRIAADSIVAASASSSSKGGKGKASNDDDALDDLFPRVDLEKLVPSSMIASINDANWKTRKEALETIQSILEANKRLKPSTLSDLTTALKLRLADSNKIVQGLALDVVARIATGMGKAFDKLGRAFAAAVANVLADQKVNIRAAGIVTLTAIADAGGLEPLIVAFDKPLEAQNPLLRKELLGWLEGRFQDADVVATLDLTHIAGAVISCLEDRNADVRKSATALLPAIVARAGYGYVVDQTSKLKPASRATVVPLIEAARGSGPSASSTKAAAAPPASKASAATKSLRSLAPSAPSPIEDEASGRTGAPRPRLGLTKGKIASTTPSSRASPVPTSSAEPPFRTSDPHLKTVRSSKETGSLRWIVENLPRPDQVEALLQQMNPVTSSELLGQLFSTDHNAERDYAAGLTTLTANAKDTHLVLQYGISQEELRSRMLANLDVIFKYITLRIGLTSTTITVKCLDLIDALVILSDAAGYKLSDYETTPLLISLIGKVGDGKETIRLRVRTIFRSLCDVYPSSRVFSTIVEYGLMSKNVRTRTESAEELGSLFKRNGVGSFPLPKSLQHLGKLVGDRDAGVRSAAMNAIGAAYVIIGPELTFKHIGTMADKDRAMLDERLKRTPGALPPSPARSQTPITRSGTPAKAAPSGSGPSTPSGIKAPSRLLPVKSTSRLAMVPTLVRPPASVASITEPIRTSPPSRLDESASISRPSSSASSTAAAGPSSINSSPPSLIALILSENPTTSVESLKKIQEELQLHPDDFRPEADALVDAIVERMKSAFNGLKGDTISPVLRLCKHLLHTLSNLFDATGVGLDVSAEALAGLLSELAHQLLATADNPASDAITSLSKVLNMVLIRIFHNSDQTACLSALFAVLQDATVNLRDLPPDELQERGRYAELVMKCLWKISKTVKESLENNTLSAPRLLRDINNLLNAVSPMEWKRRLADHIPLTDMPLRTAKTILQTIVVVYGDDVLEAMSEIDLPDNSFVYQYLFKIMNNASASTDRNPKPSNKASSTSINSQLLTESGMRRGVEVPAVSRNREVSAGSSASNVSDASAADIEMNQALKAIFDMIGDPSNSKQGIADLYQFQKGNPQVKIRIASWLSNTGNYFQNYLKRSLENMAIADEEKIAFESTAPTGAPRPISTYGTPERSSATPRASRLSTNFSNGQDSNISDLRAMFGVKESNGTN